jgi:hypothetical protein
MKTKINQIQTTKDSSFGKKDQAEDKVSEITDKIDLFFHTKNNKEKINIWE